MYACMWLDCRFLSYRSELDEPLSQPLVISMPVSLRRAGAGKSDQGNEVCMALVELAD